MSEKLDPKEVVTFQELLVSNVIEQEALLNLLERKGITTKKEITEEIQRLRKEQQ